MSLHVTINNDPLSTIQITMYLIGWFIPWIYGIWSLIDVFVNRVIYPLLEKIFYKIFNE